MPTAVTSKLGDAHMLSSRSLVSFATGFDCSIGGGIPHAGNQLLFSMCEAVRRYLTFISPVFPQSRPCLLVRERVRQDREMHLPACNLLAIARVTNQRPTMYSNATAAATEGRQEPKEAKI